MSSGFVGKLVIAFGVATFVASIVAAFGTGEFLVDLGAPIIVVLGVYVGRKSLQATKVALVVMACYVILPLLVIAMRAMGTEKMLEAPRQLFSPWIVKPLERMMQVIGQPWVVPSFLVIGAVAAVLTMFLAILTYRLRKAAATPPPIPPLSPPPPPPLPPPPAGD